MKPLLISGLSLVSALGDGLDATWQALHDGRSALAPCQFETLPIDAWTGEAPALDAPLPPSFAAFDCRNNRLAARALAVDGFEQKVARAVAKYGARRVGVFTGTSTSGILNTERAYAARNPQTGALPEGFAYAQTHNTHALGRFVRARLGLAGVSFTLSTACAATAKLFAVAARMIGTGLCDAAVIGGADSFCDTTLLGFHALGVMAQGPCRPFDEARNGISIGEAAGFALLERAQKTTGPDELLLFGAGESADAYHMSSPDPNGTGAATAMRQALTDAGLAPEAIDYINLHGTATLVGDSAEDKAVTSIFGPTTPRSSTKGFTGHTLGAAGMVGAAIAALAVQHDFLPGSPHTRQLDPAFAPGHLLTGRATKARRVMCNAFGFGGVNCSFILGSEAQ
ncbi:beta-ketoacyl-[acyl-carrier-protein] synthase family protein [Acidocella sp.]|uniref:beta-ketoacyl-[acyl-carrier-protein] synthase family protein n=1 Tax=Acidocella sp. TaxID=50710 RepID=UPI0026272080|nr:beta-ketoacyl-[acyl-carrier-protein] synthase family protein [Acidocella sp.]